MPEPRVVEPHEVFKTLWPALRELQRSYGCLVVVDSEHRSQAKGTGIFARIDGREVLVTACHVATSDLMRTGRVYVLMPRSGAVVGETSIPKMTELRIGNVIWSSTAMDVAILAGVDVATPQTGATFIDGDLHAAVAGNVRKRWRAATSDSPSLPYFVLGFPDFAHLIDEDARVETLTSLPLPGYVEQLDEHAWQGDGESAPQLLMEIEAQEPTSLEEDDRARIIRLGLVDPCQTSPFGGYSGGPVAVVGRDGAYVIGVVKEGGRVFGKFRIAATPWDDVIAALRRSNEWQAHCGSSR